MCYQTKKGIATAVKKQSPQITVQFSSVQFKMVEALRKAHMCSYMSEWVGHPRMCQWLTSTFENCGCTALDMLKWREMTEQIDRWAKQLSQVACFSEVLRNLSHYLWAQRWGIAPLILWKRELWKEEVLDNFPWKDEKGSSSIRRTLEPFQRWHWENFWETGCSTYWLFWVHGYHLELNWTEHTYMHACM